MAAPHFRMLRIVTNTSASTEAFLRRTNELTKFVSGVCRQNQELQNEIIRCEGKRLTIIKVHPTEKEDSYEGNVRRCTISLQELAGTTNPNIIYRQCRNVTELMAKFRNVINAMKAVIAEDGADVALLGGTWYVPWCLLEAARECRIPIVLCYAGILSREITHFQDDMQKILKDMEQRFYDPSIFYVFPSEMTRLVVENEIFGKKLPLSRVVHNGVPNEFLAYKETKPLEREIPIAFVGRLTPVKNPEFLVELAETLRKLGKNHRIHMVTAADQNNKLVKKLSDCGVIILPPLATEELRDFYLKTDVVVCPSRFETYGNVSLEAVTLGTPALVSPYMGICEVFRELGLGDLITDFSDSALVAERIEAILASKRRVPGEIRDRIRNMFAWPDIINTYLGICANQALSR